MNDQLSAPVPVGLATIVREWGRIGCIGFGGPPTHLALLRRLCVQRRGWIDAEEFEHAIAATNLLPGPASTQLAIWAGWRLRGAAGAVVGGVCFIAPGLILILLLSALLFEGQPPVWVLGAAAGAGSAVAAVALRAAADLVPASWKRTGTGRAGRAGRIRWCGYLAAGAVAAALTGPWLVLVLIAAGLTEVAVRAWGRPTRPPGRLAGWPLLAAAPAVTGGLTALTWVALKVGALSYGGGFVIIPLMRADAVDRYHWMTDAQFLNAVALGQITPGPVVQTVAVVGYAAAGLAGGLLAASAAFAPSFIFVVAGAPRFDRLRTDVRVQAFLTGAGAAVIGAIAGSAIPLALALTHGWQAGVLAAAALALFAARVSVLTTLLAAGLLGVAVALAGWPVT